MQPSQFRLTLVTIAKRQPLAVAGILLLICFLFCAILAPWLAPHDPAQLNLTGRLLAPGHGHWFGTDELGRDILSRTLYGSRISLIVAVSVVSLSLAVGLGSRDLVSRSLEKNADRTSAPSSLEDDFEAILPRSTPPVTKPTETLRHF